MPARNQQRDRREFDGGTLITQKIGSNMSNQVINAVEGFASGGRERFRGPHSHHESAGEPGASSDGNRVNLVQLDTRLIECLSQHRHHRIGMCPGCNFWHHTPVFGVLIH